VNFFGNEYLGQRKGVFSGIVDDPRGVEYSLLKGTKVGAGPEQSGVGIKLTILESFIEPQHHHKEVPYTPGVAKTLHARCPIIL
jgi:hypothetical protein